MNITKFFITILFFIGLGSQAQAGGYKIFDIGKDGDEHYYRISCQDPFSEGTVVVNYAERSIPGLNNRPSDRPSVEGDGLPPVRSTASSSQLPVIEEICMVDSDDEVQCRQRWSVAAAAQAMCR